jgi:hypothetical protein
MDPQAQDQGGFEKPAPQPSADMIPSVGGHNAYPAAPETASAPPAGIAAQPITAMPASAPPPMHQPTSAVPVVASTATTPAVADDIDLIEKEWVEKAKHIVAQTRTDPYQQNSQMTNFKADYMKKRYNKDIKIET